MDKPYDNGSKRLLDLCTQEFLNWLARGAIFTGRRSEEFQSVKIDADAMIEAWQDDARVLVHFEVQSGPDSDMAQRMLEYSVLAYRRYQCPILSYVIYLRTGGSVQESPLVRMTHNGKEILRFSYEVILLRDILYTEILDTGLVPLALFALDGARRQVVDEIIERLESLNENIRRELLALTSLFASLVLTGEDDQEWLERRFAMLDDFLAEAPLYQKLVAKGREEGLQKGREEGLANGLASGLANGLQKGLQKGRREGLERGLQKARREQLQSLRQKTVLLFQKRFPTLSMLAQGKVACIDDPELLEDLLLQAALAQSMEEARNHLLAIEPSEE